MKIIALLCLTLSSSLATAGQVYEVVSKKGPISVKAPYDTEWRLLKSKTLQTGTLIRTDLGSRVEISLKSDKKSDAKTARKVRITQPMLTRLDEDLIRRMETKAYPLKAAWTHGEEAKKEAKESPLLSFGASFFRSIVTLDKTPELPPIKDENPEEEKVQIGAHFLPIEVLSPGDEALFFLDPKSKTVKIPVMWNPPKDGLTYNVYVWREDEPRMEARVSQQNSWYALSMNETGRFKLQIEDQKHQYRSTAITFVIDKDLRASGSMVSKEDDRPIELEFPLERATVLSTKPVFSQRFSWTSEQPLKRNERYRLVVSSAGKILHRKETTATSEAIDLKPGQYTWLIEKISGKVTQTSRTREWNFERKRFPDLSENLKKKRNETIVIDFN